MSRPIMSSTIADAIALTILQNRTIMVIKGIRLAARGQSERFAVGMEARTIQIPGGIHKFTIALYPRAMILDLDARFAVSRHSIDVEIRADMVDNALAVTAGVAHIIAFMVGMAAQIVAIRLAAIEIADALMVADKEDATHILARA